MSFVLLHADRLRSVATDHPLIRAADVPSVRDAADLLVEAGRLRDAAEEEIAAARAAEQQRGYEAGFAEGKAAADAAATQALATIEAEARAREDERRRQIAQLAIEVVRRIAGEIDDSAMVAGLAERAAAGMTDGPGAIVRVAPAHLAATQDRLAGRPVTVQADEGMDPLDCVVETAVGRTHAGLEIQLAALERAWRQQ